MLRGTPSRRIPILVLALSLVLTIIGNHSVFAETENENEATTLAVVPVEILMTKSAVLPLPVFTDDQHNGVDLMSVFNNMPATPGTSWPASGRSFNTIGGKKLTWNTNKLDNGEIVLGKDDKTATTRYMAFFVQTDRWQKAKLNISTQHPVVVVLDGNVVSLSDLTADKDTEKVTGKTGELTLPIGKHLVTVRSLFDPESEIKSDWTIGFGITVDAQAGVESLEIGISPKHSPDIQTVLNAPRISGASISPDGKLVAVWLGEYRDGDNRETWLEIRSTKDGELKHTWRGGSAPSSIAWSPSGQQLTFSTSQSDAATIWLYDLKVGSINPLVQDIKDFSSYKWLPDGSSLIYEVTRSSEPDSRQVKRVLHQADRQPWWRGRSHLMQVAVPEGITRQLTAGTISVGGWTISPDSKRMMFQTSTPTPTVRPFSSTTLWMMDLENLSAEVILEDRWVGGMSFGPDEDVVCLTGASAAFDSLGLNVPQGVVPNDYDGQAFLYNLKTKKTEAISRDFDPAIGGIEWSLADGYIYAQVTDTQYHNVYRFKPGNDQWQKVDTGIDSTDNIVLARDSQTAVAYGSSVTRPNQLFAIDLKKNRAKLILDPGVKDYTDIVFGKVESWPCTLENGQVLDGFVYYPPQFDPAKKYPVIVYFYGGTSPITRDFGGRYPKNIWAGQDYIVYVPNPSGATGYGQVFSAVHVNDWGIVAGEEIIEGTQAFLAANSWADADHVGCMGASFGGFLTEYVITRTDIFAASISHAGISSISSYWGEGMWGYSYGSCALSGAYPWKDKELYIKQSPLFAADKINTPLLLVHGDSDINVPIGESDQLFTAMKILGKDVEYVQIVGQDHHILNHKQRIVWNDTILSYFAKYLKERPGWWDNMYPEPTDFR